MPDESLLMTSVLSIGAGAMCAAIMPGAIAGAMMLTGVGGITYYFSSWSKFDRLFRNLGLGVGDCYPIKKRKARKDGYELYEFTLPPGLSTDDFAAKQTQIEQYLGYRVEIEYLYKNLIIKVFDTDMPSILPYEVKHLHGKVPIYLGCDRVGRDVYMDMADGAPHLLIAGETGSGKSTVIRSIITNLILTTDVELFLIDMKFGVEFLLFDHVDSVKGFADSEETALTLLHQIFGECERRYRLFRSCGCKDIDEYNKRHKGAPIKHQVVVVDEFAELTYMSRKEDAQDAKNVLARLAALARASGIYMIICTQRPDAQVLDSRIKANLPLVLGLKTLNATNSRIVIGDKGLEALRGKGHGLLVTNETVELQCPNLTVDRSEQLLKPYVVQKAIDQVPVEEQSKGGFYFDY